MSNHSSSQKQAEALLSQMTVKEKIGQLCQRLYGFDIYHADHGEIHFTEEFKREVEECQGLGTLYGLYRADPWSGRNYENGLVGDKAVRTYNQVQKYVLEHSRLSIPVMMSSECPHGHQALDGYLLPVNLASGAAFSPELLKEAAKICAQQLKGMGVDLALVSLLDILRDPRWGRSEECFGEDPYLASCLAKAAVEGIQQQGCAVVAKHFCGQGETTGGVNASAARIGVRELREIHLPAAKACCEAGVQGIMAAYNEIDGIYCHANGWLLNDILRKEFGFHGIVMADGLAIDQLDLMTGDNVRSAAVALTSGVDVGLWDQAFSRLGEALERGLVNMEDLDRAVLRVLTFKYECGLFDQPFIGIDGNRTADLTEADLRKGYYHAYGYDAYPQSRKLAEETAVLLKNDNNILPLVDKSLKIAVIGPNADDIYRQIGDYSPPLKRSSEESRQDLNQKQPQDMNNSLREPFSAATEAASVSETAVSTKTAGTASVSENNDEADVFGAGRGITIWEGLLRSAEGRSLRLCDGQDFEQIKELTEWCDLVVLVLGGSSSRFDGAVFDKNGAAVIDGSMKMDCGEGVDAAELELMDHQEALFAYIKSLGKKVITLIIAGRPYVITDISDNTDALLYAFYPGPMGGAAIADLIYGRKSPSGRLPVSLPRSTGQLPVYYNHKNSYQAMHYYNEEDGALYAFGEGFGYSSFRVSEVRTDVNIDLKSDEVIDDISSGGIRLSCTVENVGDCEDAIVLQCYRRILESDVAPRVRELKAFQKLWLKKGERRKAVMNIGREFFEVFTRNGAWEVQRGRFELILMDSGKVLWKKEINI